MANTQTRELKNSDMTSAIETHKPPDTMKPWLTGFVLRDEPGRRQVVRLLPELRATIQIVLGDTYWLRDGDASAAWLRAPNVGLWGPRFRWAFGWPQGHIRIFGLGLTPMGLRALTGHPAGDWVNRVVPLQKAAPKLAKALRTLPTDNLQAMAAYASGAMRELTWDSDPHDPIRPQALECLATEGGGAVAESARLCGVSERHFRRIFEDLYGATPKLYQRVRRIDRMIRSLHPKPWESDALKDHESGFADQPHMIREFQALTGLSPEAYARAMERAGGPVLRSVPDNSIAPPKA